MESLRGKVYAVTGLAGIGLSVAKQLHSQGALLSIADIDSSTLEHALAQLNSDSDRVLTTIADIGSAASVNEWISRTVQQFGRLDGAANMAGVIGKSHGTGPLTEQDDDDWDRLVRVNLSGTMYCLRAQLRSIQATAGAGSIVTAASIQGLRGFGYHAAYVATKHGVVGLTKSVAMEVAPTIRVNAVAP